MSKSRRKPPEPIASFRVYPDRASRLHFRVRVFASVKELHGYLRSGPVQRKPRGCAGIVSGWTRLRFQGGRYRAQPDMGEIALVKGKLGATVLSHEAGHAALRWCQRIKVDPMSADDAVDASEQEEKFCDGLGSIMRDLVNGLHDHGLLPQ